MKPQNEAIVSIHRVIDIGATTSQRFHGFGGRNIGFCFVNPPKSIKRLVGTKVKPTTSIMRTMVPIDSVSMIYARSAMTKVTIPK